jgi:hypothetical protein
MKGRVVGQIAAVVAALVLTSACATMGGGGSGDCKGLVADKIKADHPQSRGASFDSGSVERRRINNNAVAITGRGTVRTAKGGKRGFTYSCVYNERNGRLSKVQYSVN